MVSPANGAGSNSIAHDIFAVVFAKQLHKTQWRPRCSSDLCTLAPLGLLWAALHVVNSATGRMVTVTVNSTAGESFNVFENFADFYIFLCLSTPIYWEYQHGTGREGMELHMCALQLTPHWVHLLLSLLVLTSFYFLNAGHPHVARQTTCLWLLLTILLSFLFLPPFSHSLTLLSIVGSNKTPKSSPQQHYLLRVTSRQGLLSPKSF